MGELSVQTPSDRDDTFEVEPVVGHKKKFTGWHWGCDRRTAALNRWDAALRG